MVRGVGFASAIADRTVRLSVIPGHSTFLSPLRENYSASAESYFPLPDYFVASVYLAT
jgi:hypothetical protein